MQLENEHLWLSKNEIYVSVHLPNNSQSLYDKISLKNMCMARSRVSRVDIWVVCVCVCVCKTIIYNNIRQLFVSLLIDWFVVTVGHVY